MKIVPRLKPLSKASTAAHVFLNILLALIILVIIVEPIALPWLAVVVYLMSKWRMFAVKPRHWIANIRANMVDIILSLGVISFMSGTGSLVTQLLWVFLYSVWLLFIKPRSSSFMITLQAMSAQTLGLIALFNTSSRWNVFLLVLCVWLICYSSARHFFSAFDDQAGRLIAHIWAVFGAQMAWVLSHWTLSYSFVPQIAFILSLIGYTGGVCYYLHAKERLRLSTKNQFIFVTVLIIAVIALFSEWQYSGL